MYTDSLHLLLLAQHLSIDGLDLVLCELFLCLSVILSETQLSQALSSPHEFAVDTARFSRIIDCLRDEGGFLSSITSPKLPGSLHPPKRKQLESLVKKKLQQ